MKQRKRSTEHFNFILIFTLLASFILSGCTTTYPASIPVEEDTYSFEVSAGEQKEIPVETVTASLAVTGDIMVHSYQYEEAYDQSTGKYDFMHNFTDMKKYFDSADYSIGNFETVLAGEDVGISDYPCFNTPDSFLDSLKYSGIDFVTTANNHCMDKGTDGLLRTIDKLDEYGFDHTGTYKDEESRNEVFVKDINGITFAFLSYTYGTNGRPVKNPWNVNILDEELIKSDIEKAKELNPDFIVVLPHMGVEYEIYPREEFKEWADFMFNCGADIILASHPHVLQPMEVREITKDDGSTRNGFIIYSLGNFISSQTTPPRNAGIIINLDFEKKGIEKAELTKVSFIPVWTQFRNAQNINHFMVRSVYEMLTLPQNEMYNTLRQKDIARLKDIHKETTSMYLNRDVPLEEIQDEYTFWEKSE